MSPSIPWYITLTVVTTNIAIAVVVWLMLSAGISRAGLPTSVRSRLRIGSALLLSIWLAGAFLLAPTLRQALAAAQTIPPVLVFSATALVVALVAVGTSPSLRQALAAVPLPSIVGVQVYRVIGAVFLILLVQGVLPAHFALPAGWGDVAVGLAAPLVALNLARRGRGSRSLAAAWNVFGLLDLVVAVGMGSGLLVPLLAPDLGRVQPAAAIQGLPLALVPAFAVPISVLLHLLALGRLWGGQRAPARLAANEAR